MLLVSGWARRAPFLWAVLPPLAIGVAEKIAFNTSHFAALLGFLFGGGPENRNRQDGDGSADTTRCGWIPHQPGVVDRPGSRRGIPRRSGPLAPLSGTDLTGHLIR